MKRFFATKLSTYTQANLSIMSSQTEPQQAYQIPAKPYYLAPSIYPLEEICAVTYNLTFVSEEFRNILFFRISGRPWPTTFGMFDAPPNSNALKMIIGEDGYFLKLTTRNCDVDIIWHDRQNNRFLFWGPSMYNVIQAMNQIRSRIIKYTFYVTPTHVGVLPAQVPQQAYETQPQEAYETQPQEAYDNDPQVVPQRGYSIQPQEAYEGIEDISDDEDDDFADMPDLVDSDGNIVN